MNRNNRAFSLVELVIVVAIIGLLTALAEPAYTDYIIRTNRIDAKDKLTEVVFELERFNTRNRKYTEDLTDLGYATDPVLSDEGFYSLSIAECTSGSASTCVNVTAAPESGKRQADDGDLTLNTQGTRTGKWD